MEVVSVGIRYSWKMEQDMCSIILDLELLRELIPTRLKSTRLPNKPLAMINGKPLIQHVYEHAIQVHPAQDVYIAAGDKEIVDLAKTFGAKAILTDASLPSGTDRIVAAMNEIDPSGEKYDTVVNFQGDGINVDPRLNLRLVELLEKTGADWMTVGKKITDPEQIKNPATVKIAMGLREGQDYGRALYFSRSPVPFNRDGKPEFNFAYWHSGIYVSPFAVSMIMGVLENSLILWHTS